jgi:hypothetical protein
MHVPKLKGLYQHRVFEITLLLVALELSGCGGKRIIRTEATPILAHQQNLDPRTTYTFRIENLSKDGDTMMHLLRLNSAGGVEQVARNDNRAPRLLEPQITYTPRFSGNYLLLVYAKSTSSSGTCDIVVSGAGHSARVLKHSAFGGSQHRVIGSSAAEAFVYESVLQPGTAIRAGATGSIDESTGAATDTVLIALNSVGDVIGFDDDGGVGAASRIGGIANVNLPSHLKPVLSYYRSGARTQHIRTSLWNSIMGMISVRYLSPNPMRRRSAKLAANVGEYGSRTAWNLSSRPHRSREWGASWNSVLVAVRMG